MIDWDDLRIFTVAARSGSLAAAGARLGMDPTTVGRRIQRLETVMKTTLLTRSGRGLQLTADGARLHGVGERMELALETTGETDHRPTGNVRLSASEGFGTQVLAPALVDLQRRQGGLTIELAANQGFLSPSTREADIAITLTPSRSGRVFVESLTDYELGLYGARDFLEQAGRPATVAELPGFAFVGYIDDMIYAPELRYLAEVHPQIRPRLTSSSIRAQLEFVRAGAGLAVLPCFMAAGADNLERLLPAEVRATRTFWVSTHHDIKNTPRVRAVLAWLKELAAAIRPVLAPTAEQPLTSAAAAAP